MIIENGMTWPIRRIASLFALAVAPLLAAAVHPQTSPISSAPNTQKSVSIPETAADVVNAFHTALKRGDTNAALKLMSEDAVIFESGGVERNRAEYEAHHLKADAAFSAATSRTPVSQVVATDGNLASVMSVENVAGTFRGRPINSRSVETMVLRKTDGQWRIIHIHWSSADIKPK